MELSYFSHVLTTSEKLEEEPYEKVAISPLLWYNSGTDQTKGLSGLPKKLQR